MSINYRPDYALQDVSKIEFPLAMKVNNIDNYKKLIVEQKKPSTEQCICNDFIYMKYKNRFGVRGEQQLFVVRQSGASDWKGT